MAEKKGPHEFYRPLFPGEVFTEEHGYAVPAPPLEPLDLDDDTLDEEVTDDDTLDNVCDVTETARDDQKHQRPKPTATATDTEASPLSELKPPASPSRVTVESALTTRENRILADAEAYLRAHPDRAGSFCQALASFAEEHRPPSTERTLNVVQAKKWSGLSHVRLLALLEEGKLGERIDDKPRFSEKECYDYRMMEHKPGPAKKK
jgi:hypothetical protein